jgi:SAM-dependent methyltransferase
MAIKTANITPEESVKEQLKDFVLEVGTHYADSSKQAVERLMKYMTNNRVVDLGCGDGASTQFFEGVKVIGVDINAEKLKLNPTATVQNDMISFLQNEKDNSIPNIFSHHALEHLPNPQKAIDLIGKKLAKGGYVYLEVPANDHIHSVHHATFDEPNDLLPPGLELVESSNGTDEHYIIAKKNEL